MNLLGEAAAYCRRLTRRSQSNFYHAFFFLSPERREALHAVYAYCRTVDDIVDGEAPEQDKRRQLEQWRRELECVFSDSKPTHPIAVRLQEACRLFPLRQEDALAVLEGCEMDLTTTRYATWQDLRRYCYHVASAVGLLCIEIFGYRHPAARNYAVDLGLALQLTNILRDVAEDGRRGRIYLPQEDLAAFSVSEEQLLAGRRDAALLALLRFEAQRARMHYLRARASLRGEDRRSLLAAEIMGDTYYSLLCEIEARQFAVFPPAERISLPRHRKLSIALSALGRSLLRWPPQTS
ncbi:MAG: presqualene diphosphate synthase HpnD [Myxococcales bacterium]|nr:presqualene diphosphate synthase HpnD [Myxococcota bacterium]MDW8282400.1 presqualene diphosphate synthase HpnD [Myxococcales bacterium]